MRTTLVIPDPVYRALKARAAETGRPISGLVTEFVRRGLEGGFPEGDPEPLPTFDTGRLLVDPADRSSLYRAIDRDGDIDLYGPEGG